MRESINKYCAAIGTNPSLVQGAGGNVSWKADNTLWIKASGTWLADAASKDIFVPVDLVHLRKAIALGDFGVTPKLIGESTLRPSIETLLHALMPQAVVVHLHAIEILAHLVRPDYGLEFEQALRDSDLKWTKVEYFKPGAALATAVFSALEKAAESDIVFLQNHGVVIGGADVVEIERNLNKLILALAAPSRAVLEINAPRSSIKLASDREYMPVADSEVHLLATDIDLYERLTRDWNLYPDHVVFLGTHPACFANTESLLEVCVNCEHVPELVFICGLGVFAQPSFGLAKQAQLRCYYDVIFRQKSHKLLNTLNAEQIAELLNWDAEQYRMHLAK